ncbi:Heterogeneous nuclear ribonucleoprotein A/B [Fasciola gigantica]|uniref:Heterogeneous nuclear ribonucleoprotein A/B n=1 Tax=Fasciola gigantica TaxID=46835 RepID=A0A504YKF4_FASGI|nr:Heterogeneous nuclear ribonucleoprotein A/B [Fasciola gigantica]
MPPVESPRPTADEKDDNCVGDNEVLDQENENIDQPSDCAQKPSNGSGDTPGDDSDDDSRKLFVGGLSWETTESDLKEYFSRWGRVTQCIIKLDRYTGASRGFGFVTLENEDCVNKVLSVPEHWLKNKKIDPKKAKPSREPFRKVFVGGIDPDVTEDQIREYFGAFGKVESLDLPFDTLKGKRKHYIFVSFATEAAARKAISKERQEIFGRQCDVRVAVTREQANRQKVMKHWSNICETYAYPFSSYGECPSAYSGFDPYGYGYYGYDYYGNAAAAAAAAGYGAFPGVQTNQFRSRPAGSNVGTANVRGSATAVGHSNNRILGTGNSTGTLSGHQPPANINYNLLTAQQMDHHALTTGLDFSTAHPSQVAAGMVAGAAAGFPHQ